MSISFLLLVLRGKLGFYGMRAELYDGFAWTTPSDSDNVAIRRTKVAGFDLPRSNS